MFQFLCECCLVYEQLIGKIKMGGYGADLVSKVIGQSITLRATNFSQ